MNQFRDCGFLLFSRCERLSETTVADNLLRENEGYTGIDLAEETAYIVGSIVIDNILENWDSFEHDIPAAEK